MVEQLLVLVLTVLEIEALEVGSLHQVPQRLGLEGGETRITDLPAAGGGGQGQSVGGGGQRSHRRMGGQTHM